MSQYNVVLIRCEVVTYPVLLRQLFLDCYYLRSNMAAEYVVIIFGLKVEDAVDSFEDVQTKIKEIDD